MRNANLIAIKPGVLGLEINLHRSRQRDVAILPESVDLSARESTPAFRKILPKLD